MQENYPGNTDLEPLDVFEAFNDYLLLSLAISCILTSVFVIQPIFMLAGQLHLGISIAPMVGIVLPFFLIMRRFPRGFRAQLCIRAPAPGATFQVVLATLAMVVIVDHAYVLSRPLLPPPNDYIEGLTRLKPDDWFTQVLTFVGLCIAVPFAEEIVFRGMIQQVFARNMGPNLAFVLAGSVFAVLHLSPHLLLSMICFGIFLGYVFHATHNLTYTIISHAVLNAVAFAQLMFAVDENLESAPFYVQKWWTLLVALVVVLILLMEIKKGASAWPETPEDPSGPHDVS